MWSFDTECGRSRRVIDEVHYIKKKTEASERPAIENVKNAILHIKQCEPCRKWFVEDMCGIIRRQCTAVVIGQEPSRYKMHREMHMLLKILPFVPKDHAEDVWQSYNGNVERV